MEERMTHLHWFRIGLTAKAKGVFVRLLALLLLVLMVREWIWMPVLITGESMLPTLRDGQLVGVNKLAYLLRAPRRGDIVEVWTGKELMTKRVLGLPGEEIAARRGTLYVNGSPLPEPYAAKSASWNVAVGKLELNSYLVAGDNRSQSLAAVVSRGRIVGRLSRQR